MYFSLNFVCVPWVEFVWKGKVLWGMKDKWEKALIIEIFEYSDYHTRHKKIKFHSFLHLCTCNDILSITLIFYSYTYIKKIKMTLLKSKTIEKKYWLKLFVSSGLLKHQQRYQQLQKFIVLDRGFAKKLDFMIILLFWDVRFFNLSTRIAWFI